MSSQRHNAPHNSPEDDFGGDPLIFKFDQDPRDITIINPTTEQLETALSHLKVALHSSVIDMAATAVRNETPLNRSILSLAAESSRTCVEERWTTGWPNGEPEPVREIRIKRLPPQSKQEEMVREDEVDFQLLLKKTPKGEVEASLTWDIDDMAYNLNELRARWERVDNVCRSWGTDPLPWDLSTLTITPPDGEFKDTHYTHKGLRVGAYPAPDEVILDYVDEHSPKRDLTDEDSFRPDTDEEEDNDSQFGIPTSAKENDTFAEDADTADLIGKQASNEFVEPEGHDLVIQEPTANQLARISTLSKLAINKETFELAIAALRADSEVEGRAFAATNGEVLKGLYFQSSRSFSLQGDLVEERTLSFHDADEESPVAFSIELTSRKSEGPGAPRIVDAWCHWETLSSDAKVAHWEQIVRISKQKPR